MNSEILTTKIIESISESIAVKTKLMTSCMDSIAETGLVLAECVKKGGKILLCGNGGSAADSQHLAAELVVRLRGHINRRAIAAIALTVDTSILTAGGNDIGFDNIFARGVEAYGAKGDALIAISTSGVSENVYRAAVEAKKRGMKVIGLLGKDGGQILGVCDLAVVVPSSNTARIQESHIMVGHIWCETIEEILFPELFENK